MVKKLLNVNIKQFTAINKLQRLNWKAKNFKFFIEFCFANNYYKNFKSFNRH